MTELLFAIGVTIAVPSVFIAILSAAMVQVLGLQFMMYGVGVGLCGLVLGLVPMGASAIIGAWS